MTDVSPVAVEFTVPAADARFLGDLAGVATGVDDVVFGPVRDVPVRNQLYFDLAAAGEMVVSVTAVISGMAGAAQTLEYIVGRLRPKKSIVVTVGATSVLVTGGEDPEKVRQALRAALKLV